MLSTAALDRTIRAAVRVLTILLRFGTELNPRAEQQVDEIHRRKMPEIARDVVVVDNALTPGISECAAGRVVIGGDNTFREFSGFDCGVGHVAGGLQRYDLVHFVTDAFHRLYVDYLARFTTPLLHAVAGRPVCLGHIDCYNQPIEILGFRSQHWMRTGYFFLPPEEVQTLGSFVRLRDRSAFFSGDPAAPFRPDAPLSRTYQEYLIDWITGHDIGQGVQWHSGFALTPETLPTFEWKAQSIMNEHLLGIHLRALGCRLIDVTWLATMLARGTAIDWKTPWQQQLAHRDQDALVVAGP